ncbi:hypothetical protein [Paenibacillus sp. IHBB 10380]|uniref:hypothetical protein n=1 Tax=Paenibacillus sp. IHBB 10380 TaxID=1566358 RepID=UPI0005CFDBC3|nr:hypothetical protein [Paenibacillus sp. IHBB 10380]AJS59343.1 hypothetical protein UB51_13695 [Paenibacillus sp. IHBB 10380]
MILILPYIVLIVTVILSLFIVYKSYISKKKAGDILFKGNAKFKKGLVWTTTGLCLVYFFLEVGWFRYVILLFIALLPVLTDKFYVGKHGIKIGLIFIPKEDVSHYSQVEDSNEIHMYVKGIDDKLVLSPELGYRSKRLKEIMDTYLES